MDPGTSSNLCTKKFFYRNTGCFLWLRAELVICGSFTFPWDLNIIRWFLIAIEFILLYGHYDIISETREPH